MESFEEQVPEDERSSLVRRLLASGANAPRVLLESAIASNGEWAATYAERARGAADEETDVDELVRRVIKAHGVLARSEGSSPRLSAGGRLLW